MHRARSETSRTANEGPVRIHYKCLVLIYVPYSTEMKLLYPKQSYNVLSLSSYTYISVRDSYISRIGLTILLQENMWTNPGNPKLYCYVILYEKPQIRDVCTSGYRISKTTFYYTVNSNNCTVRHGSEF